jgi:hypothetical protein
MARKNGLLNDNVIMRPMCYDNYTIVPPTPDQTLFLWVSDVVDYAKSCGISPQGFQVGLKTFRGTNNQPPPSFNLDAIIDDPAKVIRRCSELLRPNRIGLIIFALPEHATTFLTNIAKYNFALNGVAKADGTADFSKFDPANPSAFTILPTQASGPVQVPLGATGVARILKP